MKGRGIVRSRLRLGHQGKPARACVDPQQRSGRGVDPDRTDLAARVVEILSRRDSEGPDNRDPGSIPVGSGGLPPLANPTLEPVLVKENDRNSQGV